MNFVLPYCILNYLLSSSIASYNGYLLFFLLFALSTLVSLKISISATAVFFIVESASPANSFCGFSQCELKHRFLAMVVKLRPLHMHTCYGRNI